MWTEMHSLYKDMANIFQDMIDILLSYTILKNYFFYCSLKLFINTNTMGIANYNSGSFIPMKNYWNSQDKKILIFKDLTIFKVRINFGFFKTLKNGFIKRIKTFLLEDLQLLFVMKHSWKRTNCSEALFGLL